MKKRVVHSFYWKDKDNGYCHTCRKEIKANTAFHFSYSQQQKLGDEIKDG